MLHQGRGGALTPFLPLVAGDLSLANRIVMAPLTHSRAGTDGVPTEVMVDHYAQRSSVGLIISEGTFPSLAGKAFDGQPGLVTDAQLAGWRKVTDAVHARGGLIVAQVMHGGRAGHPDISGFPVEAPSAIAAYGETRAAGRKVAYPVPHALETDELPGIVEKPMRLSNWKPRCRRRHHRRVPGRCQLRCGPHRCARWGW